MDFDGFWAGRVAGSHGLGSAGVRGWMRGVVGAGGSWIRGVVGAVWGFVGSWGGGRGSWMGSLVRGLVRALSGSCGELCFSLDVDWICSIINFYVIKSCCLSDRGLSLKVFE